MTREEQEREQLLMEKNRQCKWDDHMRSEDRLKVEELKNENYTIWTDDNYLCQTQMTGGEIESKSFDFAADAICEAEDRKWGENP